jgi:hypothetical protein
LFDHYVAGSAVEVPNAQAAFESTSGDKLWTVDIAEALEDVPPIK